MKVGIPKTWTGRFVLLVATLLVVMLAGFGIRSIGDEYTPTERSAHKAGVPARAGALEKSRGDRSPESLRTKSYEGPEVLDAKWTEGLDGVRRGEFLSVGASQPQVNVRVVDSSGKETVLTHNDYQREDILKFNRGEVKMISSPTLKKGEMFPKRGHPALQLPFPERGGKPHWWGGEHYFVRYEDDGSFQKVDKVNTEFSSTRSWRFIAAFDGQRFRAEQR